MSEQWGLGVGVWGQRSEEPGAPAAPSLNLHLAGREESLPCLHGQAAGTGAEDKGCKELCKPRPRLLQRGWGAMAGVGVGGQEEGFRHSVSRPLGSTAAPCLAPT